MHFLTALFEGQIDYLLSELFCGEEESVPCVSVAFALNKCLEEKNPQLSRQNKDTRNYELVL